MTSPNKRLFIGSIPYRFTEGELLSLFVQFGRVMAVAIIKSRWGKSRGMGYVEFDNVESAIAAKTAMHNYLVEDRTIIVDFSKPDPMNTPEGQARHEEAAARRPRNPQNHDPDKITPPSLARPAVRPKKTFSKFNKKAEYSEHSRQSIYDSRAHHSRVGAKFASRNKKKK